MARTLNLVTSELKLIGLNLYIPLLVLVGYIFFLSKLPVSILMVQLVVAPMSCWWIVWSLEHNLNNSKYKFFQIMPFNVKNYFHFKFLIGLMLYSLFLSVGISISFMINEWIPMLSLLLPQVMFFSAMSYVLVIVTKNASVSISLIYLYVLSGVLPIVELPYWPDVFFLNYEVLEIGDVVDKSIITLLYACWFFYVANLILNITSLQQQYKGKEKKQPVRM